MRRIILSVFVWLLPVFIIVSGCGKVISNQGSDSSEPADSDITLISIISNGETILPYLRFSWNSSWTGDTWIAGDALQLFYTLPEIAEELPIVSYGDDFIVEYQEGVTFAYMSIYDDSFEQLYHIASYDGPDYFSCLKELPEGTYYIAISVAERGEYIESENEYEYSGSDCVFRLAVNN